MTDLSSFLYWLRSFFRLFSRNYGVLNLRVFSTPYLARLSRQSRAWLVIRTRTTLVLHCRKCTMILTKRWGSEIINWLTIRLKSTLRMNANELLLYVFLSSKETTLQTWKGPFQFWRWQIVINSTLLSWGRFVQQLSQICQLRRSLSNFMISPYFDGYSSLLALWS